MLKLTEFWEDYDKFFREFENEGGIGLDDLAIKSRIETNGNFLIKTFSKFNQGLRPMPMTHNLYFSLNKHDSNVEVSIDEDKVEITSSINRLMKPYQLGIYLKSTLNAQGNLTGLNSNFELRMNFKHFAFLGLGVNGISKVGGMPKSLSLSTSYGKFLRGHRLTINTLFDYNLKSKNLSNFKFLLKMKKSEFTGFVCAESSKNEKAMTQNDVSLKCIYQLNDQVKLGLSASKDLTKQTSVTSFLYSRFFDRVRVNARLDSTNSFSLGITSIYKGITISAAIKTDLVKKASDWNKNVNWGINHKFGFSAEISNL